MKYLSWLVTIPFSAVIILFSVSNRDAVVVSLWPLSVSYDVPLYIVGLAALLMGLLLGGLSSWLAARKGRALARKKDRDLRKAQRDSAQLRDRLAEIEHQRRTEADAMALQSEQADQQRSLSKADAA